MALLAFIRVRLSIGGGIVTGFVLTMLAYRRDLPFEKQTGLVSVFLILFFCLFVALGVTGVLEGICYAFEINNAQNTACSPSIMGMINGYLLALGIGVFIAWLVFAPYLLRKK